MTHSPGHQNHPDHQVKETPVPDRVQVEVNGETVADSTDVIEVNEDGHPPRCYVSRNDVRTDLLTPSDTRTTCPFKGEASYYHINLDGRVFEDAVWSYESPYDEHHALQKRMAFYDDKIPEIHVKRAQ